MYATRGSGSNGSFLQTFTKIDDNLPYVPGVTIAGSGTGTGLLQTPQGIVFDKDDNLIVADANNYRIQVFTTSGLNYSYASKTGSYGSGKDQFNTCFALCIDNNNLLYVSESTNNRIQIMALQPNIVSLSTSVTTCGKTWVSFDVSAAGSNFTYQCVKDGAAIANETSSGINFYVPSSLSGTSLTFNVLVTDLIGATATSTGIKLTVNPEPIMNFTGESRCGDFAVSISGTGNATKLSL